MQNLISIEWLMLATLCCATAAVAVWWLSPEQRSKGMEQDLLVGDGRADAVFLFDDTSLIGWSSGARKFIGEHAEHFSWNMLR
eukprot:CAMPEP_0197242992 /NCGR_PEP_ID=MMETSP1429-20130617/8579_1 /TAXON_ID=49237 /ORGANISM="Chaetoceros  sp., Strain UNC1202" /LENGTH=82 /DNA_ID=CAMNT_0042703129 /DNA_START=20 /DNA_END=264 /DNA_ORIENTATION=-